MIFSASRRDKEISTSSEKMTQTQPEHGIQARLVVLVHDLDGGSPVSLIDYVFEHLHPLP